MPFDESIAKAILRSLLDLAQGEVGRFVSSATVLAVVEAKPDAAPTVEELARRRWIYLRGPDIAASRWGLEFVMDWSGVPALLRLLLDRGKGVGRPVPWPELLAASGLSDAELRTRLNEMRLFELAGTCRGRLPDGGEREGAYITRQGWEYLQSST